MSDPLPTTYKGQIALARSIASGDEIAEQNNELLLSDPPRVDLLQDADDLESLIQDRDSAIARAKSLTGLIRTRAAQLVSKLRTVKRFLKFGYRNEPDKLARYDLSATFTPGQPPKSPLGLKVLDETPHSVYLKIQGGQGAQRFEVYKRLEGQSAERAILVEAGIKPSVRSFFDNQLEPGSRYIYFAIAHNTAGKTGPSNEVLVTP